MSNPLPSYYINTADSNVYIKCTNFGCEIIQKPKETKTCTSDEDSKLIYDGSAVVLCTKMNKLITKSDGNGNGHEIKRKIRFRSRKRF